LNGLLWIIHQRHVWGTDAWWWCPGDVPVSPFCSILMAGQSTSLESRHSVTQPPSYWQCVCHSKRSLEWESLHINNMFRSWTGLLFDEICTLLLLKVDTKNSLRY
jgi:hypothetical protein